ncbi:hypothetical protein G6F45_014182 [Rhizopus arrhizus]|nr:hypothetical protein G6F45_014182 [Rhizopus arrhizus]
MRRKHRRARVAVLEAADLGFQVGFQRVGMDMAAPRDDAHVAGRLFQQRQEQVLQIHLVMALRQAQAGGAFGSLAARLVQLPDQGLQRCSHESLCLMDQ